MFIYSYIFVKINRQSKDTADAIFLVTDTNKSQDVALVVFFPKAKKIILLNNGERPFSQKFKYKVETRANSLTTGMANVTIESINVPRGTKRISEIPIRTDKRCNLRAKKV